MDGKSIIRQIVFGLLVLAPLNAQPDVVLWWNASNKADTLMDFGVTIEGNPVTVTFTVVNNENHTVAIYDTRPEADPFYLIVNIPEVDPSDPRKEEFEQAVPLPYFIPAKSQRAFGVTYRSIKDNPVFPVDSVTEALLLLRVVDSADLTGPAKNKTFRLRALKTNNILASNTPFIKFDSVYIQPEPVPPPRIYSATNLLSIRIPVQRQILDMQTSVVGQPEITVDTLAPPASFGPKSSLQWPVRYLPRDKGRDSAHFIVEYKANQGSIPDTLLARISGIGVEQKLRVIRCTSDRGTVVVRGDTIDLGDVDADGTGGVVARVEIANEGNINVHVLSESEIGTLRDTLAYTIQRSLRSDSPAIETNLVDTLVVRFNPIDGGRHDMRYEIGTDLQSRPISGIPDGAQTKRLFFTGFARSPQMQITPPSLEFGSVVLLPTCESASERTFTISNSGNIDLRVDSIVVEPRNASLVVIPSSFIVGVADDQRVTVRYIPTQIETLQAQLVLYTNAFGVPYAMQCNGESVKRDSIRVAMPALTTARPGSQILVAVTVDSDRVSLSETAHLEVSFDPSILQHRTSVTTGTASEGATITQREDPPGLLSVDLRANGSFSQNSKLIEILFDTYLGDKAETDIGISPGTTRFGNSGCSSILDVRATSGLFLTDSVCGLDYKTAVVTRRTLSADIVPNPVTSGEATLLLNMQKAAPVSIRIVDSYGQQLTNQAIADQTLTDQTLTDQTLTSYQVNNLTSGLNLITLNTSTLPPGVYFVEIVSGVVRQVKSFVVSR